MPGTLTYKASRPALPATQQVPLYGQHVEVVDGRRGGEHTVTTWKEEGRWWALVDVGTSTVSRSTSRRYAREAINRRLTNEYGDCDGPVHIRIEDTTDTTILFRES